MNQGHPSTSSFIQSLWNGTDLERLKNIPPRMSMPSLFDSRANITNRLVKSILLMYRIPRSFTLREQYSLMSRVKDYLLGQSHGTLIQFLLSYDARTQIRLSSRISSLAETWQMLASHDRDLFSYWRHWASRHSLL